MKPRITADPTGKKVELEEYDVVRFQFGRDHIDVMVNTDGEFRNKGIRIVSNVPSVSVEPSSGNSLSVRPVSHEERRWHLTEGR